MNSKVKELLKLMQENPDLPVVPLVDSDVVADGDHSNWLAGWGNACVGHYLSGEDRYYIKEDDDPQDILEEVMGYDAYCALPEDEGLDALCDALPWKKVIFVYITTPDDI